MTGRLTRSQRRQLEQETHQKIDLDDLTSLSLEDIARATPTIATKTQTKTTGKRESNKRKTAKETGSSAESSAGQQEEAEEDAGLTDEAMTWDASPLEKELAGDSKDAESEQEKESIETDKEETVKDTAEQPTVQSDAESTSDSSSDSESDDGDDTAEDKDEDEDEDEEEEEEEAEEEEDLDELLNKAQQAMLAKKSETIDVDSTPDDNGLAHLDTRHLKLDAGLSTKDELYIKADKNAGRPKLVPEAVAFVDPKEKASKKASVVVKSTKDDETFMTKKQRQAEREKTTGKAWFDMPKAEITEEVKRDLQVLKMRHILDRKRHYKKMGKRSDPKYFQIGTIVEGPTEFYSARLNKKERKQTIVDELLANEESKQYYKRKYSEVQEKSNSGGKKHFKKLKAKRQWAK
ncbi:Fcf2 pre-rRNA processing-domain-containing protein [Mycotypha africana]|uniref:Fcf2 pre-rRNA processing-domain-containing protein n=1 Tax=Mycotypha africana TaxID=64632 RepID=UPI002300A6B7|nr:Fcf2 pre-rRNA processing-domain-containing protein [Mycotypha africana]KAI8973599.1 Fcf2 pre-rRNA processing-domain-containing protein [Mycotypha africana]